MADCAQLDMMAHAKRHVWYAGLVRDVNDLGVEATAGPTSATSFTELSSGATLTQRLFSCSAV